MAAQHSLPRPTARDALSPASSNRLRLARLTYYVGILFLAFLNVRPIAGLTLSDLLFLTATALVISNPHDPNRRRGSVPVPVLFGGMAFGVGALLSSFQGQLPAESVLVSLRVVYLTTVWFWLGTVVLENPSQVRTAVALWVVSAAASGGAALVQLKLGDVIPGATISWDRMSGLAQHVSDLGGITAIAFIPSLAFVLTVRGLMRWIAALVAFLLIGVGVVLSGSVAAMITVVAVGAVWIVATGVSRRLFAVIGIVCASLTVLVIVQTSSGGLSPWQRFDRVTLYGSSNATFWSRVHTDELALYTISQDPLVGHGLDSLSNVTATGDQVHNALLGAWYEAGLLGFLGLGVVILVMTNRALRAIRIFRSSGDRLHLSIAISFVGFLIFGLAAPILYQRYGWVAAALLLALGGQSTSEFTTGLWMKRRGGASVVPD